jgi:hypothetical protein
MLKVLKCEIFDRMDFHDFYTIKPFWISLWGFGTLEPLRQPYDEGMKG